MSILIVYASKNGTTEKCARMLAEKLTDCTVAKISNAPALSGYDTVVVGSGVHMGMLYKDATAFLKKNADALMMKRTAYFVCCGFADKYEEYLTAGVDNYLLKRSICKDTFGGEMDVSKLKGLDRMIAKMAASANPDNNPTVLPERIDDFARKLMDSVGVQGEGEGK